MDILVLVAIIIFLLFAILLFIYLSSCVVIVKQGTRKIVERFGSYRKTLNEGMHIIFRPFDRIAPVPWNVLSISQRDEVSKQLFGRKAGYYNDGSEGGSARRDRRTVQKVARQEGVIYKKLAADIRRQMAAKYLIQRGEDLTADKIAECQETLDLHDRIVKLSGENLNQIMDRVVGANDSFDEFINAYRTLGIDCDKADIELVRLLKSQAAANVVKYYPRHQDPRSGRSGRWAMAENYILDYVDLRERHIDTADHNQYHSVKLITKENASVEANIVVFFNITDPFMYYYGAEEPEESMILLAITTLRNIVSGLTLEETLQGRAEINKKIRAELDIATNNWGIKANRVEIKEFDLLGLEDAMNGALIAEREKRARILEAEGLKAKEILLAEGKAEGFRKLNEANASAEVLKVEGYKTLQAISAGKANKVFIPNDLSDFITGAHVVADAFKDKAPEEEKPAEEK